MQVKLRKHNIGKQTLENKQLVTREYYSDANQYIPASAGLDYSIIALEDKQIMVDQYILASRDTTGIDPFGRKFEMDIAAIEVLDNIKLADESVVAYIIITTSGGKVIKMSMDDLPVVARPARGNIVVNLENGEIVTAVTVSYEKPE